MKEKLHIHLLHSLLQFHKSNLVFDEFTTVDTFRENKQNHDLIIILKEIILKDYDYKIEDTQIQIAIQLFLNSYGI